MPAKGYSGTKYTDKMPAHIIKMFSQGRSRADFCAFYSISQCTFKLWQDTYPEFSEAYIIAKQKAQAWFENLAIEHLVEEFEGPKLNTKLWSMMMRNRFGHTEHRKLKIKGLKTAKNFQEQMQNVVNELADGNLTGSEALQLSKMIESGVKIYESTELVKRVEMIEQAQKTGLADDDFTEV